MTTLFIIAIIAVGIIAFIINSRISRTRPDVEFEGPPTDFQTDSSRASAHQTNYLFD